MSREILFKAKRRNWKELPKEEWWVEGLLGYDINGNAAEFEIYEGFANCETVDIVPETVCQYTGLTDKNGRKIFEGDIVLVDGEDKYFAVEWDNDTARFVMNSETLIVDFDNYWNYQVEVISNVFDNPELLEEGE